MRCIWPEDATGVLDERALEELYSSPPDVRRWLAVNFVASVDGAVEIEGRSGGLSSAADQRVFRLGRELADVVLVGAGTAMAERFRGVRPDEVSADRRHRHGLEPIPPIAVVTTGASLPPDAPVVLDTVVPSYVITCATCPSELREAWTRAGARVVVAGDAAVDLGAALEVLAASGARRIGCEGGPRLCGALLHAGLVDELRLTISALLVAGHADRIVSGDALGPLSVRLASVVTDADNLMLRYLLSAEPRAAI